MMIVRIIAIAIIVVIIYYPKNISAVKKGEAKKVQVAKRPKDVITL